MAVFQANLISQLPLPCRHLFRSRTLWDEWQRFLHAGCCWRHPVNTVKQLNGKGKINQTNNNWIRFTQKSKNISAVIVVIFRTNLYRHIGRDFKHISKNNILTLGAMLICCISIFHISIVAVCPKMVSYIDWLKHS